MRSNRPSALLGTISTMFAARLLPSVRDQVARLRPRSRHTGDLHMGPRDDRGTDDTERISSLRLGAADVARRKRERAEFADDAAYFEFIVERATSGRATPS